MFKLTTVESTDAVRKLNAGPSTSSMPPPKSMVIYLERLISNLIHTQWNGNIIVVSFIYNRQEDIRLHFTPFVRGTIDWFTLITNEFYFFFSNTNQNLVHLQNRNLIQFRLKNVNILLNWGISANFGGSPYWS